MTIFKQSQESYKDSVKTRKNWVNFRKKKFIFVGWLAKKLKITIVIFPCVNSQKVNLCKRVVSCKHKLYLKTEINAKLDLIGCN